MSVLVSTTTLLAWATPTVAATVIFYWLFNPDGGVVDWALARLPGWLGGGAATWAGFNWMTSALPVYTVATLLLVWQGFPFIAVSVLAGLKTVPADLYEAARVDGASPWRVFWKITYPLLKPIFLVLLLLSVIWDFGCSRSSTSSPAPAPTWTSTTSASTSTSVPSRLRRATAWAARWRWS
jgi:N,N'-diacetylchitobiose transport system permease protein